MICLYLRNHFFLYILYFKFRNDSLLLLFSFLSIFKNKSILSWRSLVRVFDNRRQTESLHVFLPSQELQGTWESLHSKRQFTRPVDWFVGLVPPCGKLSTPLFDDRSVFVHVYALSVWKFSLSASLVAW